MQRIFRGAIATKEFDLSILETVLLSGLRVVCVSFKMLFTTYRFAAISFALRDILMVTAEEYCCPTSPTICATKNFKAINEKRFVVVIVTIVNDIEKRREFDELWAHLPRIQPELRKGRFFSTFQRSSNGSSNIGDAASSNEFAWQIEVLVERINTLRESVATLTQLCPPEVYGPTPSSHDLQKAYASLKVRYAEQAFRISGLLSSTTLSSPHKIDEERRLERCSLLRWQIERENKLIARLNLIIAGCVRRQLPIMLT
ncbi:unnamed protein product [Toxocara canis]|uniref:Syntaxin-16 n=1 Tax=Toxocara canis TaxID=6265 RepID=A0A183TWD6_TOXCA|nr:unnamed protein product [Toxocara canis]